MTSSYILYKPGTYSTFFLTILTKLSSFSNVYNSSFCISVSPTYVSGNFRYVLYEIISRIFIYVRMI